MVILNTCHIREKAAEKVFSELGRLQPLKARKARRGRTHDPRGRGLRRAGRGRGDSGARARCRHRARAADLSPPARDGRARRARRSGPVLDTEFPAEAKFDFLPEAAAPPGVSRLSHGAGRLRQVLHLLRRALYARRRILAARRRRSSPRRERLVARGAREITLLGQNVNAYHGAAPDGGEWGLGRLIRALAEIPGLARIRYTTSHPRDMDDDLIAAHRDVPQLMPFLHLPVQSGSDRVLAAMNRRHTRRRLSPHRSSGCARARPDIALSSDFIVGFPGESEADFEATLDLVREVGFAQAFSFKYSPRPGHARRRRCRDQVPEAVKAERLARLQALLARAAARLQSTLRSAACCRCCSRSRAGTRASSSGAAPICSRSMPRRRRALIGARRAGADRRRRAEQPRRRDRRGSAAGAGMTGAPTPRASADGDRVQMQFDDNSLLPLLFGERDRNLDRIERAARRLAWSRAAIGWRSPGPPPAPISRARRCQRSISA